MEREYELKFLDIDASGLHTLVMKRWHVGGRRQHQRSALYDFPPYRCQVPWLLGLVSGRVDDGVGGRYVHAARAQLQLAAEELVELCGEAAAGLDGLQRKWNLVDDATALPLPKVEAELSRMAVQWGVNPNKWLRLRTDGKVTTLAVKRIQQRHSSDRGRSHPLGAVIEVEVEVGTFESCRRLLEAMGFFPKAHHEKIRVLYEIADGVTLAVDHWPGIPPYLEVEARSVAELTDTVSDLAAVLKNQEGRSMNADDVFTWYGKNMYADQALTFEDPDAVARDFDGASG